MICISHLLMPGIDKCLLIAKVDNRRSISSKRTWNMRLSHSEKTFGLVKEIFLFACFSPKSLMHCSSKCPPTWSDTHYHILVVIIHYLLYSVIKHIVIYCETSTTALYYKVFFCEDFQHPLQFTEVLMYKGAKLCYIVLKKTGQLQL